MTNNYLNNESNDSEKGETEGN